MAKIEFLGYLSDRCGREQNHALPQSVQDVASLRSWLNKTLDGAPLSSSSIRAIVNSQVATETQAISDADKIAFFPPVGGG